MHRCVALLYFFFAVQLFAAAQNNSTVTLMDFVKIKEGKTAEAMFFYENNWKAYRDMALKKNIIQSYEMVKARPDSLDNFDLILITVYKDSAQFAKSEENFRSILTALRPNGPLLLNEVKPADFRQNLFVKVVQPVHIPSQKKRKNKG